MANLDLDRRLTKKLGFGKVLESMTRYRHYYIAKKLESFDLGKAEYKILIEVYISEGCCQEDIVQNLYLDKFEVAKGIKSLINKDYIYKEKDSTDKRKYKIYLSQKAKDIKDEFLEILLQTTSALTKDLTDEEKEFAMNIMIKMANNIYSEALTLKNENK